jgi:chorismate mutase
MNLGDWRSRIDRLDDRALNLLNQRAEAALRTGDLQRRQDAPSSVPREAEAAAARPPTRNPPGPWSHRSASQSSRRDKESA